MRSAARFIAMLATGVLIMMIYIWSGESVAALIMAIVTLFAVVAIIEWKPWAVDGDDHQPPGWSKRSTGWAGAGTGAASAPDHPRSEGDDSPDPVWRSEVDITCDDRGVSGVAIGERAPRLWSWLQIVDIQQVWYTWADGDPVGELRNRPEPEEGEAAEAAGADDVASGERIGLCLSFPMHRNPEKPAEAGIMFGPDQDPDTVVHDLRSAWRRSKVAKSRFYDLTLEERTREMAQHFGANVIDLRVPTRSPELLYQEVRRSLLAGGRLCRLAPDAPFDEVLDRFDGLLEANAADPLTRAEADALAAADGPDHLAGLHWT
ncbi:MAG: hypothetical protein WBM50_19730, partial [Acidimicrobiales bacterium]